MPRYLCLCLALCWGFVALPSGAAEPLVYIEFKLESDQIEPGSFLASTRKLWRVGYRYLRIQEEPNPDSGIHGLLIANAPNSYMINLYTMEGNHIVDPGPSIDVHVPVFSGERDERLKALEMGHEFEFFSGEGVKIQRGQELAGVQFDRYTVSFDDYEISMFAFAGTRTPFLLALKHPDRVYAVQYVTYEVRSDVDPRLFDPPKNVTLNRVN